jgi:large subunit ribosomal protein L4
MKIQTFTVKGVKGEDMTLPAEFNQKPNLPLLAQALYVYEKRGHVGLRKTKTRAEINRTTKKVYKQKGTGGARHGSRRANLFVGGGVALGPRPVKRELNLSNDLKTKAKALAYAQKAEEKQMVAVSGIASLVKTKEAKNLITALTKVTGAPRFTFVLSYKSKDAIRALRNLVKVNFVFYRNSNALDIYKGGMIVMDAEIFKKEEVTKKPELKEVKKVTKKVAAKK